MAFKPIATNVRSMSIGTSANPILLDVKSLDASFSSARKEHGCVDKSARIIAFKVAKIKC